jgi:hypothetical protein
MKNSHKNISAFRFLELLAYICSGLTQDEVLYWARSEEKIKEIFAKNINEFSRISYSAKRTEMPKMYNVDAFPNKTSFQLFEILAEISSQFTDDQLQFWLNSPDLVTRIFTKGEIFFLREITKGIKIEAQPEGLMRLALHGGPFRLDRSREYEACQKLKKTYPESAFSEVRSYDIACGLKVSEASQFFGGGRTSLGRPFTPQQIRYFALRQREGDDPGPLLYDNSNYFPIETKDGFIIFLSLVWCSGRSANQSQKDLKNKWKYWVLNNDWTMKGSARLFLQK